MVKNLPIIVYTCIKSTYRSATLFLNNLVKRLSEVTTNQSDLVHIRLCITEALANAIIWGNKNNTSKRIIIQYTIDDRFFSISIEDEGQGFITKRIDCPGNNSNLLKDSGRGLLFMKTFMDEVVFNQKGNRVTMTKYFS